MTVVSLWAEIPFFNLFQMQNGGRGGLDDFIS